jgi:5-methylcytosine-specific restriction endonuclease McrA
MLKRDTDITSTFLIELKKFCIKYPCVICRNKMNDITDNKRKITLDHIKPLRNGGKHYTDNVYCICADCNSKKKHHTNFERDMFLKELNKEFLERMPW